MLLLKNAHLFDPEDRGIVDLLIHEHAVVHVGESLTFQPPFPMEVVDLQGRFVTPGFMDHHVHIIGGGGEGGPQTSTPEIQVGEIIRAGVTTVFGVLGTDGITRSPARLHAKSRALEWEGISTYMFSGAYQWPLPTLTGSIANDIVFVDKVVGVGELAISDHRSSFPDLNALAEVAGQARVAGMLSGKGGKVVLHLGGGKRGLKPLGDLLDNTELPPSQFIATHLNRNRQLQIESVTFGRRGVICDFTAGETKQIDDDITASEALAAALEGGVPLKNLTLSSDGQGSLPIFNERGELVGIEIGSQKTLLETVKALVFNHGWTLTQALAVVTSNVADVHKLPRKGRILAGADADLQIFSKDLNLEGVIAKGKWAMREGTVTLRGVFES